jgi:hypothetical protein
MIKTLTKILMAGSAVAVLSSAAFAEAQAPALKMSGFTSIIGLAADQTVKDNGKGGTDPSFAISSSDFRLTVGGKSITDFGYKYVVNFKTIPGQDPLVNRNYVEFDSNDWGSIQVGVVKGPDDSMVVDTYSILGGTGGNKGFGGFNYSEGVIMGTNLVGSTDIATKMNWFSPTVAIAPGAGTLQIALSYTPNTSHTGKGARDNSKGASKVSAGNEKNAMYPEDDNTAFGLKNFVYGVTYANTFGDYTLTLNAVTVSEHSRIVMNTDKAGNTGKKTYALNRTGSYQLSGMLSVKQWDFTASWLDNKKSRLATQELSSSPDLATPSNQKVSYLASNPGYYLGNSGQSWNMGARYSFGAYQAAIGYFRTDRKTDATQRACMDTVSTTLDFKALEGLKFFGELNYLRTKTNKSQMDAAQNYYNAAGKSQNAIGNNTGAVLILGTKVSF